MSAVALLKVTPKPTRDEARLALSGNLCRCGAYDHYLNAVMRAGPGGVNMAYDLIGKNFTPPDIYGKVTGKANTPRISRRRHGVLPPADEPDAGTPR